MMLLLVTSIQTALYRKCLVAMESIAKYQYCFINTRASRQVSPDRVQNVLQL